MKCPLCAGIAPHSETWEEGDYVTVDYFCNHGHLIQFILPDFLFTLMLLNDTGDELLIIHFNESDQIIRLYDRRFNCEHRLFEDVQLDLEGTGVEVYQEDLLP